MDEELPPEISSSDLTQPEKERLKDSISNSRFNFDEDLGKMYKAKLISSSLKGAFVVLAIYFNLQITAIALATLPILLGMSRAFFGKSLAENAHSNFKQTINPHENKRFVQTVNDISADLGLQPPLLYPFSHPIPNAAAIHSYFDEPVMSVSYSLIKENRESVVRSIIAHELGHIKHKSGKVHIYRGLFSVAPVIIPLLIINSISSVLFGILLFVMIGIFSFVALAINAYLRRREEYIADKIAVQTTSSLSHAEALIQVSPQNPFSKDTSSLKWKLIGLFRPYPYMRNRVGRTLELYEKENEDSSEPISASRDSF